VLTLSRNVDQCKPLLSGPAAREAQAKRVLKTVATAGDAYDILNVSMAGAYTRPLLSST